MRAACKTRWLVGDPGKPGFYAVMTTKGLKGNHFSRPHFDPNDRYITVLQGTWWVGSGPKFDPANTTAMPAGSFVTHFGKQVHWDGAKDEDAVLLIMGEGPEPHRGGGEIGAELQGGQRRSLRRAHHLTLILRSRVFAASRRMATSSG